MTVDKSTVNTARDGCCVFGDQFRMSRVRRVVESNTVLSIRRTFARDHENLAVGCRRDVVDETRIDFDRVRQFWICGIGDVIDEKPIGDRRIISIVADDPLFRTLKLLERSATHDFDFAFETPRLNENRSARRIHAAARCDDVSPRQLGNESSVVVNGGAVSINGPLDRDVVVRISLRLKRDHVASASSLWTFVDHQCTKSNLSDSDRGFGGRCSGDGCNRGFAWSNSSDYPARRDSRNLRIIRSPFHGDTGARIASKDAGHGIQSCAAAYHERMFQRTNLDSLYAGRLHREGGQTRYASNNRPDCHLAGAEELHVAIVVDGGNVERTSEISRRLLVDFIARRVSRDDGEFHRLAHFDFFCRRRDLNSLNDGSSRACGLSQDVDREQQYSCDCCKDISHNG